jgi:hypothetical protein
MSAQRAVTTSRSAAAESARSARRHACDPRRTCTPLSRRADQAPRCVELEGRERRPPRPAGLDRDIALRDLRLAALGSRELRQLRQGYGGARSDEQLAAAVEQAVLAPAGGRDLLLGHRDLPGRAARLALHARACRPRAASIQRCWTTSRSMDQPGAAHVGTHQPDSTIQPRRAGSAVARRRARSAGRAASDHEYRDRRASIAAPSTRGRDAQPRDRRQAPARLALLARFFGCGEQHCNTLISLPPPPERRAHRSWSRAPPASSSKSMPAARAGHRHQAVVGHARYGVDLEQQRPAGGGPS